MAPITWKADQILEVAVSALKGGHDERCAHLCVQAIKIKPDFAEAFHVRGIALLKLKRPFDALLCIEQALQRKPDMADGWNNRGQALADVGLWDEARESFQRALSIVKTAEPHILCGGVFAHLMKLEAAEKEFKAALEIEPDLHDAHIKLGVLLLAQGKWEEGFPHYHWRWYDTPFPPRPWRTFKLWDGLRANSILLYSEQGFGDEIMSLRFVETVRRRCDRVVLEVRPTMARIVRERWPDLEVIAAGDDYPEDIEYSCPLLDVPMMLGIAPDTMPVGNCLVRRRPKARLRSDKINVGLCWSSGRRPLQPETELSASAKSIPVEMLRPLMDLDDINFVSLQMPKGPIPRDMPINPDLIDRADDIKDTADVIELLDLVITVDTAVAHLAGAISAPVWNLVRFNGYWPWMQPTPPQLDGIGEATPWYPTMRLFRQPELGDWDRVIDEVRERLVDFILDKKVGAV